MFLKGVNGVFHRNGIELWCSPLHHFLSLRLKLPGLLFGRSAAEILQKGRFGFIMTFLVAGPLFGAPTAQIYQKGVWQPLCSDASFSSCWTPFCAVSGLDPSKRGPPQPDFRLATLSCCLDPCLWRERPGSSKKGSCDLASNFCFRVHLFSSLATRRRCTCLSSLFCLWPLHSVQLETPLFCSNICRACPVCGWRSPPFCSNICRACPSYKGRLAHPRRAQTRNLQVKGLALYRLG